MKTRMLYVVFSVLLISMFATKVVSAEGSILVHLKRCYS
jgi:hypothetical protein